MVCAPLPISQQSAPRLSLQRIDPLSEDRHAGGNAWDELVARHPNAGIFHTSAWARVLNATYGYQPVYFAEARPAGSELGSSVGSKIPPAAVALLEVNSRWTGRRGASLPFTDDAPLLESGDRSFEDLLEHAREIGRERHWKTLEIRSVPEQFRAENASMSFHKHHLDLTPGPDQLFASFDGSVRRAIRKAQNGKAQNATQAHNGGKAQEDGLTASIETSPEAVADYYKLHCLTRHKHGLPPQPFAFFQNIQRWLISRGAGFVVLARKGSEIAAGAVYLHFKRHAVYKFGASDPRHEALRPNNLVMWTAIQHLAKSGFKTLDFGRTSFGQEGLRRYKLNWGTRESTLNYAKWDFRTARFVRDTDRATGPQNTFFRACPGPVARLLGRILYPHIG